jgi:hypothetical protein
VYPHIGDFTNLAGYPPLKPNIIFCDYLLDHNLSLRMDYQFKEDRKMVPRLKISSISPKEIFPVPTLYLSPLCPRTSKRLSMGEEVGTMQSSKGSKQKNFEKKNFEKEKEKNEYKEKEEEKYI